MDVIVPSNTEDILFVLQTQTASHIDTILASLHDVGNMNYVIPKISTTL